MRTHAVSDSQFFVHRKLSLFDFNAKYNAEIWSFATNIVGGMSRNERGSEIGERKKFVEIFEDFSNFRDFVIQLQNLPMDANGIWCRASAYKVNYNHSQLNKIIN